MSTIRVTAEAQCAHFAYIALVSHVRTVKPASMGPKRMYCVSVIEIRVVVSI